MEKFLLDIFKIKPSGAVKFSTESEENIMKEIRIKSNTRINCDRMLSGIISFGIVWGGKSSAPGRITFVNIEDRKSSNGNGNPWYIENFIDAVTCLVKQKTVNKIYLINRKTENLLSQNQLEHNASVVITRRF